MERTDDRTVSTARRYAVPTAAPAGRMDLLTAIMHELGHGAGLSDFHAYTTGDDVMYRYLDTGERRLPGRRP